MAGTNTHHTIREARTILAKHGMTVRSEDGDYIVNFKGAKNEDAAYFATNLHDAIGTGIDMAERRAAPTFTLDGETVVFTA